MIGTVLDRAGFSSKQVVFILEKDSVFHGEVALSSRSADFVCPLRLYEFLKDEKEGTSSSSRCGSADRSRLIQCEIGSCH